MHFNKSRSQRLPEPCFLLPNEWPNLHFLAESNVSSQSTTPMGQHIDERSISPYYPTPPPDPAPSAKAFTKWMFYLNDEFGKAATICVHPRFFVTFRHGTHVRLKIGDVVKMYHAEKEINEQHGVEVRVAQIHPTFDFILLKSDSDLVERGPTIAQAEQSEPFTLAGFGNQQQNLSFLPGCIYTTKDYYFDGEGGVRGMGPFIMGTSRSSRGGGIWSARGLLGANSGCTSMPLYDHNVAISEAAIFSAKNLITSAFQFKVAYLEEIRQEKLQEKVPSPPPKKPCVAKWENMGGIFYGSNV
ncbi:hypothetical protein M3Y95_00793100 [Aphelenchoides besseyi]|nr:hypothetical protein M3Y95_00793100 [Aphelenchoides besseyi]